MSERLNPTDEDLHDSMLNFGSSRIIQILWRFSSDVPTSALQNEWNRLNQSRLSRRAVAAHVPGARRKWVRKNNAEQLQEYSDELAETDFSDWIDKQVLVRLPINSEALWRLAALRHRNGTLVSLTVPHFRSDGLGVFRALKSPQSTAPHRRPIAVNLLESDMVDALRQTVSMVTETTRWGFSLLLSKKKRARIAAALETRGGSRVTNNSGPVFFSSAIFDLDATSWKNTARAHRGTTNSLFIEIAANLARARLQQEEHSVIRVGIPVNLRRSDADNRANAVTLVTLAVPAGAPQHEDLSHTRRDTKAILRGSDQFRTTLVPEPLWHMLPRRYAHHLIDRSAQQADVIVSNLGYTPDEVTKFAGQKAESVAFRVMNVPGLMPHKVRMRASLCMLQTEDRVTLTVTGSPDEFGDGASLRRLVAEELVAWGLQPQRWC